MGGPGRGLSPRLVLLALFTVGSSWDLSDDEERTCEACVATGDASFCVPDDFFHDCSPACYPNEELHGFFGGCKDHCFGGYQYQDKWDCQYDSEYGVVHWILHLILKVVLGLAGCCCVVVCCQNLDVGSMLSTPSAAEPLLAESHGDPRLAESVAGWMRVPSYWTNQDLREDFDTRHNVDHDTSEVVEKMLQATFRHRTTRDRKGSAPTELRFMKLQRIEDRRMWVRYQRAREALQKVRGRCTKVAALPGSGAAKTMAQRSRWSGGCFWEGLDDSINEMFLWHGTSPQGATGISENGFDLSLAGKTGLMFGKGVYLAECSSKSDEYASDGQDIYQGVYALLLCRAVCGEMFRTEEPASSLIDSAMGSGQYDSVLGDREKCVGTYREFVVYDSDLVYPEYVVLYQRVGVEE